MSNKDQVLTALRAREGEFCSGEALAASLGVSRNAVWKGVTALRRAGYPIEAVTNRGYRLINAGDVLDEGGIRATLRADAEDLRFDIREEVSSTNLIAKERAQAGEAEGLVVMARRQSAGRGRLGRFFHSPEGTGLYMSLLLRPALPATDALLLTTAAAVAVCEAIETLSEKKAGIKWVNDVFVDGKKVCGILTEAGLDIESGGMAWAVVGIGVNLRAPQGGFPPEIAHIAGSVFDDDAPAQGRSRLAAEILNRFMPMYRAAGERAFVKAYRERSLAIGRTVTLMPGGERALALDVDSDCRLIVRMPDGQSRALSSGEISIKL